MAGSAVGHTKSQFSNKLYQVYTNVWKEYNKFIQSQKGVGGTGHTIKSAISVLNSIGMPQDVIQQTLKTNPKWNPTQNRAAVNPQTVGDFIYKTLQNYYQTQTDTNYQTNYRLPEKV